MPTWSSSKPRPCWPDRPGPTRAIRPRLTAADGSARLIAAARALGKPVIFIRNVPAHLAPGLAWVAASCDAVSDDGFGVQLARFNPIGLAGSRPADPVYADTRDPREPPAVRALLDEITAAHGLGPPARP